MWSKSSPEAWPSAPTPKPRTNIWFTSAAAVVQPLAASSLSANNSQKPREPNARARPSPQAATARAGKTAASKSAAPNATATTAQKSRGPAAAACAVSVNEIPNQKSSEPEPNPCSTCRVRQKHVECEFCKQSVCSDFCLDRHPCPSGDFVAPRTTTDRANVDWFENLLRFPNVCSACQTPASYGFAIDHDFYDDTGERVTQRFYFCDAMHQMWYLQCPNFWNFYRHECAYCDNRCTRMFCWRTGSQTYDFCNDVCKSRFIKALKPAEAGGKKDSFESATAMNILSAPSWSSVSAAAGSTGCAYSTLIAGSNSTAFVSGSFNAPAATTHQPKPDTKSHAKESFDEDLERIGEYEPWMDGEDESGIAKKQPFSLDRDDIAMHS